MIWHLALYKHIEKKWVFLPITKRWLQLLMDYWWHCASWQLWRIGCSSGGPVWGPFLLASAGPSPCDSFSVLAVVNYASSLWASSPRDALMHRELSHRPLLFLRGPERSREIRGFPGAIASCSESRIPESVLDKHAILDSLWPEIDRKMFPTNSLGLLAFSLLW